MRNIYDCFLFFNELEILELRLNILKDVVDYFILVESSTTFNGKDKKLIYNENKERFKEFNDRIIYVVVDDTPNTFTSPKYNLDAVTKLEVINNTIINNTYTSEGWSKTNPNEAQWGRETYQRECMMRGLANFNDDDIVIISDVDEIPNPNILKEIDSHLSNTKFLSLTQNMYYYYFNLLKQTDWSGTKICKWGDLKLNSVNQVRQNKFEHTTIPNGGWHFSFFGGENIIKDKIQAYSHQEFNNPHYLNSINSNMKTNMDPFFRGQLTNVEIDETYPKYILDNIEKYKHMIK